jgi:hypothetical protein
MANGSGTAIVSDGKPLVLDRVTVTNAKYVVDTVLPVDATVLPVDADTALLQATAVASDAIGSQSVSIRSWRQGPGVLSYVQGRNGTSATGDNASYSHLPPQRADVPVPTWGRPAFDNAVSVVKYGRSASVCVCSHAPSPQVRKAMGLLTMPRHFKQPSTRQRPSSFRSVPT